MDTSSETTATNPTPPVQKKGNFFTIFGKIMLVLLVIGGLVFGGYYLGTYNKNQQTSPTPTPTTYEMQTTTAPTTDANTVTKAASKTVKAGLTNGATSFKPYSIEIPSGWTDNTETTDVSNKLTVTKDGYSVNVYQAAFGGGGCLYPGDPDANFAQHFTNLKEIVGKSTQFRRSWNLVGNPANKLAYTVCQKHPTENSYATPSGFGAIDATSPSAPDATIMAELDGIIASITAQ